MSVHSVAIAMNNLTPTLIVQADNDGCRVYLHNPTGTDIYIGNSDVTTSNGIPVENTQPPFFISLQPGDKLYGIAASDSPTLQVLKIGN